MDTLVDAFAQAQQVLFEAVVQPVALWVGADNLLEQAYEGTGWLLAGMLQIAIMLLLFAPLERFKPVEHWTDRSAVRVDVIYTLIHRLGVFKLVMFFTLDNGLDQVWGWLRVQGVPTFIWTK